VAAANGCVDGLSVLVLGWASRFVSDILQSSWYPDSNCLFESPSCTESSQSKEAFFGLAGSIYELSLCAEFYDDDSDYDDKETASDIVSESCTSKSSYWLDMSP